MFCSRKRSEILGSGYECSKNTVLILSCVYWAHTGCLSYIAPSSKNTESIYDFIFIAYQMNKKHQVYHHNSFANHDINRGSWLVFLCVHKSIYDEYLGFCDVVWSIRDWGIHCPNRAWSSNPNIDSRWLKVI